ncbi:hypothetical protein KEJ51_03345 [Candidatus Bathyarchaeota archaeon]|nr:hypothetical protein [Candidatus Bathyarchaeota archaeon]MBS7628883.1 hypothetical protein [Candidatus Bathyarchaeota archaeon]
MSRKFNSNRVSDEFNERLLGAIDESLLALGEHVRQAVYHHMENRFSIRRDEIPYRLEDFAEALRNILGSGGKVLLRLAVKILYAKLGLNFEEKSEWNFRDYVEYARKYSAEPSG